MSENFKSSATWQARWKCDACGKIKHNYETIVNDNLTKRYFRDFGADPPEGWTIKHVSEYHLVAKVVCHECYGKQETEKLKLDKQQLRKLLNESRALYKAIENMVHENDN